MIRNTIASAALALALVPLAAMSQQAPSGKGGQAWPNHTVRIIIPWAPGGQTDAVGRLLAAEFGKKFGQAFVVENRAGAGGMIGADYVAKQPADGYTLLFTSASISVNSTLMSRQFKLDPVKDLTPIVWAASEPLLLTVPANSKAKSVAELVQLSKSSGKGLSGAYNGSGTTSQVALEMLKQQAGANLVTIPYKGGGPSTVALLAGEIDLCFATLGTVRPLIQEGKLHALAVSTAKPSSVFPDLPTMKSTYPDFESDNWFGLFGPAGLPPEIVGQLNAAAVAALKSPEIFDRITKAGGEVVASSPQEFKDHLASEIARYAKVIKASDMKPE
jgi:tripartite-type tricarboxylate transporter receptor subunit TctC